MAAKGKQRTAGGKRRKRREFEWESWPLEDLLDLRLCELHLTIEGSEVADRITQLYEELDRKGIRFRPHVWLSSDWFSPVGVPGIAIPFYLAHPRLKKLEYRMMYEVEGGTRTWCMQLLRHETGHAIDTAYRLNRRASWRRLFGKASKPYPKYYNPKPFSRNYVLHLDWWYAQSHPTEDFAETFAVWLKPGQRFTCTGEGTGCQFGQNRSLPFSSSATYTSTPTTGPLFITCASTATPSGVSSRCSINRIGGHPPSVIRLRPMIPSSFALKNQTLPS